GHRGLLTARGVPAAGRGGVGLQLHVPLVGVRRSHRRPPGPLDRGGYAAYRSRDTWRRRRRRPSQPRVGRRAARRRARTTLQARASPATRRYGAPAPRSWARNPPTSPAARIEAPQDASKNPMASPRSGASTWSAMRPTQVGAEAPAVRPSRTAP